MQIDGSTETLGAITFSKFTVLYTGIIELLQQFVFIDRGDTQTYMIDIASVLLRRTTTQLTELAVHRHQVYQSGACAQLHQTDVRIKLLSNGQPRKSR